VRRVGRRWEEGKSVAVVPSMREAKRVVWLRYPRHPRFEFECSKAGASSNNCRNRVRQARSPVFGNTRATGQPQPPNEGQASALVRSTGGAASDVRWASTRIEEQRGRPSKGICYALPCCCHGGMEGTARRMQQGPGYCCVQCAAGCGLQERGGQPSDFTSEEIGIREPVTVKLHAR